VSARPLPLVCALALASCSSARKLPPGLTEVFDATTPIVDSSRPPPPPRDGCVEDARAAPAPDAQGLCGNMFLDVTTDAPNLFFVIDRSGSMAESIDGTQKYDGVATAAVSLVRSLGSLANVGAAVFPGHTTTDDGCASGDLVFPATPGDPLNRTYCGDDGPVTRAFSRAISLPSGTPPRGSTPTASTLRDLLPMLSSLKGRTFVLLATDGGPNCNYQATCSADKCIPNIEHSVGCNASVNCCDPQGAGPSYCLDDDGTKAAVAALYTAGIKTYVIGITGSVPYAELLNELAIAGGTARVGANSAYYGISHIAELDEVLGSIGATVTLSCHIRLASPPPDSNLVNVYLDGQLVKYGPNGWQWGSVGSDASTDAADDSDSDADTDASEVDAGTDDAGSEAEAAAPHTEIDLVGTACDTLKSGKVRRLQVVFGCPTDIPR
jgi:hypothetical protein